MRYAGTMTLPQVTIRNRRQVTLRYQRHVATRNQRQHDIKGEALR